MHRMICSLETAADASPGALVRRGGVEKCVPEMFCVVTPLTEEAEWKISQVTAQTPAE